MHEVERPAIETERAGPVQAVRQGEAEDKSRDEVRNETGGAAVSAGEGRTGDGTEDDASAAVLDAAATLGAPIPDPTTT